MLGTLLGMAPGIIATLIFVDRVTAVVTDPGADTLLLLLGFAALLVAFALFVHRRLARRQSALAPSQA